MGKKYVGFVPTVQLRNRVFQVHLRIVGLRYQARYRRHHGEPQQRGT